MIRSPEISRRFFITDGLYLYLNACNACTMESPAPQPMPEPSAKPLEESVRLPPTNILLDNYIKDYLKKSGKKLPYKLSLYSPPMGKKTSLNLIPNEEISNLHVYDFPDFELGRKTKNWQPQSTEELMVDQISYNHFYIAIDQRTQAITIWAVVIPKKYLDFENKKATQIDAILIYVDKKWQVDFEIQGTKIPNQKRRLTHEDVFQDLFKP